MTLFRSILWQLFLPYLLATTVLSFILSMDTIYRLINLIVSRGVSVSTVSLMLLYRMPQFLSVTLPIALVISIAVVVNRLSSDSEVIALQSTGLGFFRLSKPFLLFGLFSTVMGWSLTLWLLPRGFSAFEEAQIQVVKNITSQTIQPKVFHYDFWGKILYVQNVLPSGHEFSQVFVADREMVPGATMIFADTGRMDVLEQGQRFVFQLSHGTLYQTGLKPGSYRTTAFESMTLSREVPPVITEQKHIWGTPTQELLSRNKHSARVELLLRLSTPLASLGLAMGAMVLSIYDPRKGKTGAYLRVLVLVGAYYVLWLLAKDMTYSMKKTEHLLWIPPATLFVYGLYACFKIEHSLSHMGSVIRHLTLIKKTP